MTAKPIASYILPTKQSIRRRSIKLLIVTSTNTYVDIWVHSVHYLHFKRTNLRRRKRRVCNYWRIVAKKSIFANLRDCIPCTITNRLNISMCLVVWKRKLIFIIFLCFARFLCSRSGFQFFNLNLLTACALYYLFKHFQTIFANNSIHLHILQVFFLKSMIKVLNIPQIKVKVPSCNHQILRFGSKLNNHL